MSVVPLPTRPRVVVHAPVPSIEFQFEELRLILDAKEPDRAIGYLSGCACIAPVCGGYITDDFYMSNSAEHGTGVILIPTDHVLHPMLDVSLRAQFDASIRDKIEEEEDCHG